MKSEVKHIGLPLIEEREQLPRVVQVIPGHATEAERVQVAECDGGEHHHWGRDLVQLGDVRILQVEVDPVHADVEQTRQGAEEEGQPQAALYAHAFVGEDVRDSV